jgi:hypothetical protein
MTTYSIEFNVTDVVMNSPNGTTNIPLTELLMNDGTIPNATDVNRFTRDQSITNYYDSIKDGTNSQTLEQLDIYPGASVNHVYPSYNGNDQGLHVLENNILRARKHNLQRTSWLKLKKGHELDPKKIYDEIMWESGLGEEVFIKFNEKRKTFGSFIDPLSKTNGFVWPKPGNTLKIDKSFMKFMGFGNSSIEAKAKNDSDDYEYKMIIGCGNACIQQQCILNNPENDKKYTLGNNNKKSELTKSGNPAEKIKYIVIKEWGDKLQVIIYIMYYFLYAKPSNKKVALLACDMVVYITCLIFQAVCIYTGALSGERLDLLTEDLSPEQKETLHIENEKRHYSIVEYTPGDKFEQAIIEIQMKIDKVTKENKFFIDSIIKLRDNSDTSILIGSQEYVLPKVFYENCLEDIIEIQERAKNGLNTDYKTLFSSAVNKNDTNLVKLYGELKEFESKHLLVPFIKIKKGTSNKLTILSTKSYTAQLPCVNKKPAFSNSTETFQVLAVRSISNIGGGNMKGGTILNPTEINYNTFVQDDDSVYNYTFDLSNEPINNYTHVPILSSDKKTLFGFYSIDLLEILNHHFKETLNRHNTDNNPEYYNCIVDGIYTIFVYYSYLNGAGIIEFNEKTLNMLILFYDLNISEDYHDLQTKMLDSKTIEMNEGKSDWDDEEVHHNVAKGPNETPLGPSSSHGFALSPFYYPQDFFRTSSRENIRKYRDDDYNSDNDDDDDDDEYGSPKKRRGGSKKKTIKKNMKKNKKTKKTNKKTNKKKTIKKKRNYKKKSIKNKN